MTTQELDDFLAHYGVKGMKWGIRKDRSSGSGGLSRSERKAEKKAVKKEEKQLRKIGTTSSSSVRLRDLTDEELRKRLNRIQMEKQYADLTRTTSTGEKFANRSKQVAAEVLTNVARSTLTSLAKSHATQYTAKYMAKQKDVENISFS
jgi:hypothetical protein